MLHCRAVLLVRQSVDDKGAKLAQYILRNVSGALRGEDGCQAIFPTFFRNKTKGLKFHAAIFITSGPTKKLMGFVKENDDGRIAEATLPCNAQEISSDYVE
ncbi:hypothetical protein AA0243_2566 [Novacetimonas hansenii NRIC 0243]|nr:hypothetical protein AA0243_2566 [Novacetimonas hansenii NRIC 0243]